jgi:uncharacterized protein
MRYLPVLGLALFLPFAQPVLADAEVVPATITVTGEGQVQAAPDLATVSLGVTTTGETAAVAMEANSAALTAVMERIKAAGIEDRDVQTSNLSLNPNWQQPDASQPAKITGYVASNQLTLRVRELAKLGGILDAAIGDGANTLNGISFGLDDPEPAMNKARVDAVQKAKARAELLVGAAGVKLGRIVSMSESGGYNPGPMPMYRMAEAAADTVPVAAGEVGLTASVTITFEIAQ